MLRRHDDQCAVTAIFPATGTPADAGVVKCVGQHAVHRSAHGSTVPIVTRGVTERRYVGDADAAVGWSTAARNAPGLALSGPARSRSRPADEAIFRKPAVNLAFQHVQDPWILADHRGEILVSMANARTSVAVMTVADRDPGVQSRAFADDIAGPSRRDDSSPGASSMQIFAVPDLMTMTWLACWFWRHRTAPAAKVCCRAATARAPCSVTVSDAQKLPAAGRSPGWMLADSPSCPGSCSSPGSVGAINPRY